MTTKRHDQTYKTMTKARAHAPLQKQHVCGEGSIKGTLRASMLILLMIQIQHDLIHQNRRNYGCTVCIITSCRIWLPFCSWPRVLAVHLVAVLINQIKVPYAELSSLPLVAKCTYEARCFRIIKVSTIAASIPLNNTRTHFETPFKGPK